MSNGTKDIDALEAAQRLVACFRFNHKTGKASIPTPADAEGKRVARRPMSSRDLLPVITALNSFLSGRANTLDEAFGGNTRQRRNAMQKQAEDFAIRWLVEHETKNAKQIPKSPKRQDTPRRWGITAAADLIGMSEDELRKRFYGER